MIRLRLFAAALSSFALVAPALGTPVAGATTTALVQGSGSTSSANAVNQWVADTALGGLRVIYTATGSAVGRADFANGVTDFAVTDIAYQGVDPVTGNRDTNCPTADACRAFAYVPLVAGGLSFPYHLDVAGRRVTNLRLSGATLVGIFTGAITVWNDPRITADDHGRRLPAIAIVPVVHGEGSGATYHFSDYLAHQYPSAWQQFSGTSGPTPYWPGLRGASVAQFGSNSVAAYVASAGGNGAIGYDEYAYPLGLGTPVAEVENRAGYYTSPSALDVAVALRHAAIDHNATSPHYTEADLRGVYAAPEPRAYPLSSYSYLIMPTGAGDPRMTTAKRQAIADFIDYSVCGGQSEVGPIGFAPLPRSLVSEAINRIGALHTADAGVDLTGRDLASCTGNPTFAAGISPRDLLSSLPAPATCDRSGWGPCGGGGVQVSISRARTVPFGRASTVTCRLTSAGVGVADSLTLYQRPATRPRWTLVTARRTPPSGVVSVVVAPRHMTAYQCRNATSHVASTTSTVSVAQVVTMRVRRQGASAVLTGTVSPSAVGRGVLVQRRILGRWRQIGRATIRPTGWSLRITTTRAGTYQLRAVRAATLINAAGVSPVVAVRLG